MALDTFANLQVAVARHLNREDADFIADVPDLIALCEDRINNGDASSSPLRVAQMEAVAVGQTDEAGYADLPSDYLEMRGVRIGGPAGGDLSPVTPDFYDIDSLSGRLQRSYSITGNQIRTYPPGVGALSIAYYAKVPALSDANPTNWLLRRSPSVYLYGTLMASAPYESDDARLQTWVALYTSAIAGLRASDVGARFSNGVSRVRGPTP